MMLIRQFFSEVLAPLFLPLLGGAVLSKAARGAVSGLIFLVLLKEICCFWPFLRAFWGFFFLGFLSKSKLCVKEILEIPTTSSL